MNVAAARLSQVAAPTLRTANRQLSVTKPRQSRDAPILRELLELHVAGDALAKPSSPSQPRLVDCTYGRGNIWGRLPYRPLRVDINAALPHLDLVADWRELLRHFAPGAIDCLIWDPIHVADVGSTSKRYARYVASENPVKGESVAQLFPEFLEVAAQLVKPRTGVCLVKLCDQVHSARQQWQVFGFVAEAQRRGWTACDYSLVWRPKPGADPKHKRQLHARNQWAFWIVLRNGPGCHGPGRRLKHELICTVDGQVFWSRRSDARTCSDACRQRQRRRHSESGA